MTSDPHIAQSLIDEAVKALRKGDRSTARRLAQQAAVLTPQSEEPWLLLVYLSPIKAAEYYISRALQANPASPRVQAAQEWLKGQSGQNAPAPVTPSAGGPPGVREHPSSEKGHRLLRASAWLVVLVLVAGLSILGVSRLVNTQGFAPFKNDPIVTVSSPTITSTPLPSSTSTTPPTGTSTPLPTFTSTPTAEPTTTATPTPTETATPLPTETSTPTLEPTATKKPSPTAAKSTPVANSKYVVQSGDTLSKIAQRFGVSVQDLITANNILNPSVIFAGQTLTIPKAGSSITVSNPTAVPPSAGSSGKNKEIVIDLSEQHMWAYEDKKLVFSFVVSTGTGNSTRIGTFKVLDKIPNAYSSRFNIWMPYWLGIYWSGTLENGIHGLPVLWNGVELWGNLLGQPATYGCIEARTSEIKQLYNWAEIGTPVIIRR